MMCRMLCWLTLLMRLAATILEYHRIPPDTISLIRELSRANPLWGATRIHSELLQRGLKVAQRTVAKYMVRGPHRSPTQNWKTFQHNYLWQTALLSRRRIRIALGEHLTARELR
jgi:hypothetical protein